MATYRISAQVMLWIRVDELSEENALDAQLGNAVQLRSPTSQPQAPVVQDAATARALTTQIARLNDDLRQITALPADAFENGSRDKDELLSRTRSERERLMTQLWRGTVQGARPDALSGASPDNRFIRGGIIPASVEIERNSFRTADTARVELSWSDVPFDPRLVRACGVEIVLGSVSAEEWEAGMQGARGPRGGLRSVVDQVPAGPVDVGATRFAGWVDNWTSSFDPDDGDTVTLEARDYTALFLDTPLGENRINLLVPLDEGVRAFLREYPTVAGLDVLWGDVGDDTPGDAPTPGAGVPMVNRARRGRVARQARSGDQRMNLWDHITDVCTQCGVVPLIRDYQLRLVNPRTLFTGRGPTASRPRRMVYGRNLSKLQFARKLGGVKVPTIEVRAYDATIGRTRWARWPVRAGETSQGVLGVTNPPQALRANEVTPSGANPDERIQTFTVRYGGSPTVLAGIARSLFEQIGRQEIEGSFETSELASFGVDEGVSDLLQMTSGDPVELLFLPFESADPSQTASTATTIQAQSTQARADYLRSLGWDDQVADRFAALQSASGFQTVFRVQNSRISFDSESGISITADFVNFITVREDPSESPEATPSARVQRLTAGRSGTASTDARNASASRRRRSPNDPNVAGELETERNRTRIAEDGLDLSPSQLSELRGGR